MTIEEAIQHCKEIAENEKGFCNQEGYSSYMLQHAKCAAEHDQLAEWLTQLKDIKEAYESNYQVQDVIEVCVKLWG